MELYVTVIIAAVVCGILLNLIFDVKLAKKNSSGVIVMAASGACAILFMIYRMNFNSFRLYIVFFILTAVLLAMIYLLLNVFLGRKERFAKAKAGGDSAWNIAPKSSKDRENSESLAGAFAVSAQKTEVRMKNSFGIEEPAKGSFIKKARQIPEYSKPFFENKEQGNILLGENGPAFEWTSETDNERPKETAEYTTAMDTPDVWKEPEILQETLGEDDGVSIEYEPETGTETPLPCATEAAEECVEEMEAGMETPLPCASEAAEEYVEEPESETESSSQGEPDETAAAGSATPDETLGAKMDSHEESDGQTQQDEVLLKAASMKEQGRYLIAYHLYECRARQTDEIADEKFAELEMLDCLIEAEQYDEAGKQLFGLLNKKYELLFDEKEKIKRYMSVLQNADGQRR